jgi:hypothetical protein
MAGAVTAAFSAAFLRLIGALAVALRASAGAFTENVRAMSGARSAAFFAICGARSATRFAISGARAVTLARSIAAASASPFACLLIRVTSFVGASVAHPGAPRQPVGTVSAEGRLRVTAHADG